MTLESDLARIDAALSLGPTSGPWLNDNKDPCFVVKGNFPHSYIVAVAPPTSSGGYQNEIDASYVAACHPDAIRRIVRIARLSDQILGALRISAVLVPRGEDRTSIVAAIDALVSAKGQPPLEPPGQSPVLPNGWRAMVLKGKPPVWVDCGLDEYKDAGPMNRRLVPPSE